MAKRGRPKKVQTEIVVIKDTTDDAPKKRGRPKKIMVDQTPIVKKVKNTKQTKETKSKKDKIVSSDQPKRPRGRPRKNPMPVTTKGEEVESPPPKKSSIENCVATCKTEKTRKYGEKIIVDGEEYIVSHKVPWSPPNGPNRFKDSKALAGEDRFQKTNKRIIYPDPQPRPAPAQLVVINCGMCGREVELFESQVPPLNMKEHTFKCDNCVLGKTNIRFVKKAYEEND